MRFKTSQVFNASCHLNPGSMARKIRQINTWPIVLLFAILSGCALEHKPLPESFLYRNFTKASAADAALPDSSAVFDKDSTPPSYDTAVAPKEFTLDQAIQTALKSDPRISAAMENVRQAEADLTTAGLIPNPYFSTGGTLMPLNREFTVNRQGGPPQFDAGILYVLG